MPDRSERRHRMVQLGVAALFASVIVVAILVAVSQSGSDSDGDGSIEGASAVEQQLRGLRQVGMELGEVDAAVTVTEYGDLQCPICKTTSEEVLPGLIEDEVRGGEAKLEFKNFTIIGPESATAAKAAMAAASQGRYWNFIELFYRNQGAENSGFVTDEFLESVAVAAKVADLGKWNRDRSDPSLDAELADVEAEASALGLNGTPSFVVSGSGGQKILVAPELEQLQAAVAAVR